MLEGDRSSVRLIFLNTGSTPSWFDSDSSRLSNPLLHSGVVCTTVDGCAGGVKRAGRMIDAYCCGGGVLGSTAAGCCR